MLKLLNQISENINHIDEVDWNRVDELIKNYQNKMLQFQ